ncbi:MAG TPA: hypothetical protein VIR34_10825, partial [Gemmatimonadaceae bacterium]
FMAASGEWFTRFVWNALQNVNRCAMIADWGQVGTSRLVGIISGAWFIALTCARGGRGDELRGRGEHLAGMGIQPLVGDPERESSV